MAERRYDIDWIRVIVFDILIIWHVGLFFVSWENLVQWDLPMKNNVQIGWLTWPMLFIRQWRLPILFVISGMGTKFSLSTKSGFKYVRERFVRLFIPLLTGIFIIVPPQVYLERLSQGIGYHNFMEFYPSIFFGIYPEGNFSWGHLWFLPYLLIMSIMGLPLFMYLRKKGLQLFKAYTDLLSKSPLYLYIFVIPLIIIEVTLESRYPLTMALTNDWYAFSYYFVCFLTGYFLANLGDSIWTALENIRYVSLLTGLILSIFILSWFSPFDSPLWIKVLKPLNVWSWFLTICGFSSKYLNKENSILSYRNNAVYPFYILHFTITLILGYALMNLTIHYSLKMIAMIAGTFGLSWLLYEFIIRRIKVLRILFGIKNPKK